MPDTENKKKQAESIVKKYAIGSVAAGILPLPLLDIALLTGVQLKMLHSLAKLYDVKFSDEIARSAITSLVTSGGTGAAAIIGWQLLKTVPVIGQFGGAITATTVGAASTYAIGEVFTMHFESGGTFLTFDPDKVRDFYRGAVKRIRTEVKSFAGVKP